MTAVRIAVAAGTFAGIKPGLQTILGTSAEVMIVPLSAPEEVASSTIGADGIVVGLQRMGAAEVSGLAPGVRVISRAGIGLDTIDLDAARKAGIAVVFQPDYATQEVAAHAVSLLLAVNRRLFTADAICRRGWKGRGALGIPRALTTMTVGVIGAGAIGRAAIARIAPFVAKVLVYDPMTTTVPDGAIRVATLPELLRNSDAVTLHAPLTPQTRHLMSEAEFALMPSGSVLVNVSRGELVDTKALIAALESGHLAGAGLDVFEQEPFAGDHPLTTLPNVVLSPHVAFLSDQSVARLERQALEDAVSFITAGEVHGGRLAVQP